MRRSVAPKFRSVRAELASHTKQLRAEGKTWTEVACVIRECYRVNARVAFRLAHGWTQQDAADRWNAHWPDDPKTFKNFSYWEQWPGPTGYEPSLGVLSHLAELYHCHVADLLADASDFRSSDMMHESRENIGLLAQSLPETNPQSQNTPPTEAGISFAALEEFSKKVEETDVNKLAMMSASWARNLKYSVERRSALLFKLSFALTLAAANPDSRERTTDPADTDYGTKLSGIWRSHYSYYSSGRGQEFDSTHFVQIRQDGNQIQIESLPHPSGSTFKIDLSIDGVTLTGTWEEKTSPTGYYKGAIYRGAIQLLAAPTGGQLIGKWIGFGKNFRVDTGDWEFILESRTTSPGEIASYSMRE